MEERCVRLAEVCERAAKDCRHDTDCDFELTLYAAPCDCGVSSRRRQLRDLAAALRGAKPYDFDTQHRDDQFVTTLGDA